jgi:hypothetical protein
MAGSRAAKFVDEDIGRRPPGWMEPSGGRDTEEMHDETYRDKSLRLGEEKRGVLNRGE